MTARIRHERARPDCCQTQPMSPRSPPPLVRSGADDKVGGGPVGCEPHLSRSLPLLSCMLDCMLAPGKESLLAELLDSWVRGEGLACPVQLDPGGAGAEAERDRELRGGEPLPLDQLDHLALVGRKSA